MKTMKAKWAKAGAVMFAAAMVMSSCTNDEVVPSGTTPVGDRDAVKTSFSFAIPTPVSRATGVDVQLNKKFQGMKNLRLMPFFNLTAEGYVAGNSVLAGLTQLTGSTIGTNTDNFVQTFPDVAIPAGDVAFLFYGEANHASDYNGVLNMTPDVSVTALSPADIAFTLQNIVEGTYTGGSYSTAAALIDAWNTNVTSPLVSWSEGLSEGTDKDNAEALLDQYYQFNSGAITNLRVTLQFLQNQLGTAPISLIAGASDVKNSIDNMATELAKEAYDNFPANLPKGAYKLENGIIKFDENGPGGSGIVAAASSTAYSYPASLYYWANAYPVAYSDVPAFTQWANGVLPGNREVISPSTTQIALNKTINYGVARLDVKAAIRTADGATIPAGTVGGQQTHVTLANHNFIVKGILVGGLPDQLDWEMHPSDGDNYSKVVYDTRLDQADYELTSATAPNYDGITPFMYCLLPETADCTSGSQDDLGHTPNIALEIYNDGPQFYGLNGNVVPEDGTFYLVGKLVYNSNVADVTRVLQQDYNTTVNLTISSLAKAYNTVPDLINPRLELALAVDVEWKQGIVIDVTLGE